MSQRARYHSEQRSWTAPQATAGIGPAPIALDTDTFLTELERALGGPQTPELMTLDVLTPHVREIAFDAR